MEMARAVKHTREAPPPKRPYDASRRQAQARETQRHIADSARDLFVERGYRATSIRDIADHAGVAVQTIYNAFDGKPAILIRIADTAVAGDDEPLPLGDREDAVAVRTLTDPEAILERYASFSVGIFERFLPILPAVREAAASEPLIHEQWRTNAVDNRYRGNLALVERLQALGALRSGVTVAEAADAVWSLVSFDTAEALMVERGWTDDAVAALFHRTLRDLLLEP
jgi:AcrR family transcriptional regulator